MTLDERFEDLRSFVDHEIVRARRELIAQLANAVANMRSAPTEPEWDRAVIESGRTFEHEPLALEFLGTLAALTRPGGAVRTPKNGEPASLSAKRFARVKIAEIQLYQAPAVKAGRESGDLYGKLQPHIDAARDAFRERFLTPGEETGDYLHVELVRELANDDAALLGPGYPGPMA